MAFRWNSLIRVTPDEIGRYPSYRAAHTAFYGADGDPARKAEGLGQLLFWTGLRSLLIMPGVYLGLRLAGVPRTWKTIIIPSVMGSIMVSSFVLVRMAMTKRAEQIEAESAAEEAAAIATANQGMVQAQ